MVGMTLVEGVWILVNVGRFGEDALAQLGQQRLTIGIHNNCRGSCALVGRLDEAGLAQLRKQRSSRDAKSCRDYRTLLAT